MSKGFQNAKADRECTEQCSSKQHINQAISAITKRVVTDQELAAYLYGLCFNIGTVWLLILISYSFVFILVNFILNHLFIYYRIAMNLAVRRSIQLQVVDGVS
jgi:hypothetical protein